MTLQHIQYPLDGQGACPCLSCSKMVPMAAGFTRTSDRRSPMFSLYHIQRLQADGQMASLQPCSRMYSLRFHVHTMIWPQMGWNLPRAQPLLLLALEALRLIVSSSASMRVSRLYRLPNMLEPMIELIKLWFRGCSSICCCCLAQDESKSCAAEQLWLFVDSGCLCVESA